MSPSPAPPRTAWDEGDGGEAGLVADVIVVGLGPVGAVLAALLGESGTDVLVLEAEENPPPYPRAIAADGETLRTLLDVLGPAGTSLFLLDRGVEVRDARQRRVAEIDFPPVDDPLRNPTAQPGLSMFHQPSLESSLRARLRGLPSVRVRLGARVRALRDEPGGVAAVLESGDVVRGRWLVGCDGAASLVRRARGIPYPGRTFERPWLVVDLDSEPVVSDVVAPAPGMARLRYVIDPARPVVAMARPGGLRVEMQLKPGESAEALASPDRLEGLLRPYLPRSGVARVIRAAGYTFHTRSAQRWRDGRVLLAGDAAHSMPPFGGQGLGAGIADAAALSWRLAEVCRDLAPPSVLDAYEREQRPRVEAMSRSALMIGRLLTPSRIATAAAVRAGLRLVATAPVVGPRLRSGSLRPAPTVAVPAAERALGGGRPMPNPRIGRDGQIRLDTVVGRTWAVYAHAEPRGLLTPGARDALERRGASFCTLGRGGPAVDDRDGTLEQLLSGGAQLLLARPDRTVAAAGSPEQIDAVLARLTGRPARPSSSSP